MPYFQQLTAQPNLEISTMRIQTTSTEPYCIYHSIPRQYLVHRVTATKPQHKTSKANVFEDVITNITKHIFTYPKQQFSNKRVTNRMATLGLTFGFFFLFDELIKRGTLKTYSAFNWGSKSWTLLNDIITNMANLNPKAPHTKSQELLHQYYIFLA